MNKGKLRGGFAALAIAGIITGGALAAGEASAAPRCDVRDATQGFCVGSSGHGSGIDRSGEERNVTVKIDTDGDGTPDRWTNTNQKTGQGETYGEAQQRAQKNGHGTPGSGVSPSV